MLISCRSLPSLALGIVAICTWTTLAYAHGGGLDSYGCHHNRKAGGYHCHRGALAGQSFASQDEMLRKLGSDKRSTEEKKRISNKFQ
jgi:hypothetical protein